MLIFYRIENFQSNSNVMANRDREKGEHNQHKLAIHFTLLMYYDNMNMITMSLIIPENSNQSWNFPFAFELLLSLIRRRNEEGVEVDVTNDETMPVFPFTTSFFHPLYSFL